MGFKNYIIAGVGLVSLVVALGKNIKAEELTVTFYYKSINNSAMQLLQLDVGLEGKDSKDASFLSAPAPALDIYAVVDFDPYQLNRDTRPLDSFSTYHGEISGRGVSGHENALTFSFRDPRNDQSFQNKNIFMDLYDARQNNLLVGTWNVKELVNTATTIPIVVDGGLSYKIDVRFTPVVQTETHTMQVNFWKNNGLGTWTQSPDTLSIVYSNETGVSDSRNDSYDVKGPNWTNNFSNTTPGGTYIYTVGEPFSSDRNLTDARPLDSINPVLIELAHNSTDLNGGRLEFTTNDWEFYKDLRIQQRQPGCFNHDNGSIEMRLEDILDLSGHGEIEFQSWNTTFPWEADLKFDTGQYASFELIPKTGSEYVNPEDMPFVIMEGTYAVMFPHVDSQPGMHAVTSVPEPGTLSLLAIAGLGGAALAGIGYDGSRMIKGKKFF